MSRLSRHLLNLSQVWIELFSAGNLQDVSRSPWHMAFVAGYFLDPIKFFKTSVSCTVIG